jgi:hypothetical protein
MELQQNVARHSSHLHAPSLNSEAPPSVLLCIRSRSLLRRRKRPCARHPNQDPPPPRHWCSALFLRRLAGQGALQRRAPLPFPPASLAAPLHATTESLPSSPHATPPLLHTAAPFFPETPCLRRPGLSSSQLTRRHRDLSEGRDLPSSAPPTVARTAAPPHWLPVAAPLPRRSSRLPVRSLLSADKPRASPRVLTSTSSAPSDVLWCRSCQIPIPALCTSKQKLDLTAYYDSQREYNNHPNKSIQIVVISIP